ncbi:MAG: sulfotransferase [Candidatus Marinimicrobia bacterium]|nr:sulfotransferase [Candidatus Neomarinimicrobiota bacterium]
MIKQKIKKMDNSFRRIKKLLKENNYFFDLNILYYIYKRNNYLFDPNRFFRSYKNVNIKHPIFLLGTQGNGNTFVSRMLRRSRNIISVTGNYKYWAGADEMNSVLGPILPKKFKSIEYLKPYPDKIKYPVDWLCGTDKYFPLFRNNESDFGIELKEQFTQVIRWLINRYGKNPNVRFLDKSQTFTIKMLLLEKIFQDSSPKFILVTRNPYASCYRAATGNTYTKKYCGEDNNFLERLELACQHWKNYNKTATVDGEKVNYFMTLRFEDTLKFPEKNLRKICNFIEIEYFPEMIPQKNDVIPFGSKRRDRWYPLRPDVNEKYLSKITNSEIELIYNLCGKLASSFGYLPPYK